MVRTSRQMPRHLRPNTESILQISITKFAIFLSSVEHHNYHQKMSWSNFSSTQYFNFRHFDEEYLGPVDFRDEYVLVLYLYIRRDWGEWGGVEWSGDGVTILPKSLQFRAVHILE